MPISSSDSAFPDDLHRVLRGGGVVGYPTETVWGLATLPASAATLFSRKGREDTKPLQLSCPDRASALALAQPSPALAALSECWPGPLTVIASARPEALREWGAGAQWVAPVGWVGLRVPAHPVALSLLQVAGPLATTSLNPSGQPPARTEAQARAYGLADLLLPTPDLPSGLPSSVLQLPQTGSEARLLRAGGVSLEELRRILAPVGVTVSGEGT